MMLKRTFKPALLAFTMVIGFAFMAMAKENPKVLVFFKQAGFKHTSVQAGIKAIIKLGEENGFDVDTTTNGENFNDENLKQYSAVIFLNTSGDVLEDDQKDAFQAYIHKGGGFVGVHGAADTEYTWNWYGRLVGAYFKSHPDIQQGKLIIVDANHPATQGLPHEWIRTDEWYNFGWYNDDIKFLIELDEGSIVGGKNGGEHPLSWFHPFDGGRSFYTALGHTEESYTEPLFLKHLLGGIEYAMGRLAYKRSNAR